MCHIMPHYQRAAQHCFYFHLFFSFCGKLATVFAAVTGATQLPMWQWDAPAACDLTSFFVPLPPYSLSDQIVY